MVMMYGLTEWIGLELEANNWKKLLEEGPDGELGFKNLVEEVEGPPRGNPEWTLGP